MLFFQEFWRLFAARRHTPSRLLFFEHLFDLIAVSTQNLIIPTAIFNLLDDDSITSPSVSPSFFRASSVDMINAKSTYIVIISTAYALISSAALQAHGSKSSNESHVSY